MNDLASAFTPAPGRAARLRAMIERPQLAFLMEAHNGLSAKIVEEAGFGGIWASGLSISASLGLRDSNEASWTQVLDVLEYMADATSLPILVDGDTGYGNFNNVRRLVRKLGERNIAGVCIEDKLFPKTNSFIGEEQPLADIGEFCGRIAAGKDSQTSDDFVMVARVEALISSRPMEEALRRAEAYHAAGADAILIHSKKTDAAEIFDFCRRWGNRAPVVIVPTTYYPTPTELFREAGISTVIWANHLLRSSISAMRETARAIHAEQSLANVEGRVVPVKDIFRLMGNAELEAAERRYLPETPRPRAVVLAASGGDLGELTRDKPKCMIDVRGQSLLARQVATFADSGVRDITVVRGFAKAAVVVDGIRTVDNDRFADTGEAYSLAQADAALSGELVVAYGDVLFRNYILESLLSSKADVVIAVDALHRHDTRERDLVLADHGFSGNYLDDAPAQMVRMGSDLGTTASGEWVGLARFSAAGSEWLRAEIAALDSEGLLERADLPMLLTRIAAKHPVRVKYFTGHWMDVNTLADVADARNFT
ncbi:phosphoenolpyruvate mutase [Sphingomonas sp.]|uniref:phosphoenolpyruvate mutase n=1 Tax=Sphingomonas sp. TaxID=28214 RepID=UPI002B8A2166|nr:phosphoenolpyruvate mutase [Sphingomonas sp.]HWK35230.1 phosphoenolpyruvate mutase [Sphingomonas sp.]